MSNTQLSRLGVRTAASNHIMDSAYLGGATVSSSVTTAPEINASLSPDSKSSLASSSRSSSRFQCVFSTPHTAGKTRTGRSWNRRLASPMPRKALPKILCFHGAGSSGMIFKIQARRLVQLLKDDFELIFIDAPFESSPGPGVLPVFEGSGPYFRWHCDMNATKEFDITQAEIRSERKRVRKYLAEVFRDCGRPDLADLLDGVNGSKPEAAGEKTIKHTLTPSNDSGKVVAVLGFSQGTRVVTGLLAELQRLLRERKERQGSVGSESLGLQFAVLLCGTYAPLPLGDDEDRMMFAPLQSHNIGFPMPVGIELNMGYPACGTSSSSAETSDSESLQSQDTDPEEIEGVCAGQGRREAHIHEKLEIHSVHVHGTDDPWLPEARQLLHRCYTNTEVLEFNGGHHVPNMNADLEKLRDAIMRGFVGASDY